MPRQTIIRNKKAKEARKVFFAALLLAFYLFGNTGFGILHEFLHLNTSLVSHSPEQEKDACHRAIYHFGKDGKHHFHITLTGKHDRCNLLLHVDQISLRSFQEISDSSPFFRVDRPVTFRFSDTFSQRPPRAPPLI